MRPGAHISAVIQLYDAIIEADRPADQVIFQYFRSRKFIGSKDRKYITETIYALLRHYARLNWWAERLGASTEGRIITLLWLIFGTSLRAEEILERFDGSGYAPESLSRFERDIADQAIAADFIHADMPEAVRLECPEWAYAGLKKNFSAEFEAEMTALQNEAPLDMRVNTLKTEPANALKKLRAEDFDVVPTRLSPFGIRANGRPAFSAHTLYQNGSIEVQDEGSQLLSLLCGVKPGEWVVDFCAGAGGKTLALAAQMQNKGRIWACDIEKNRLENSRKRLRRAGVHCVELQLLDDEEDDWVRKHKQKADCVLIDAPCTGLGTWRRNPFGRWQNLGQSLKELLRVQANILESASKLVKPGGRLIYATCSMLPEENQVQVERFLSDKDALFKPVSLESMWNISGYAKPTELDLTGHMLQMTPAKHKTDGFFVSAMKRI